MSGSSVSSVSSLDSNTINEFIGEVLNSRYLILDYLDHGTFCRVYLAYDIQCDKYYAVKIMNIDATFEGKSEINYLKRTSNSHRIIKIFDDFKFNEHICMVLELMGVAAIDIINSIDATDYNFTDVVKTIICDASIGILELNQQFLIHTDLKLENIMTTIISQRTEKIIEAVNSLEIPKIRKKFYDNKTQHSEFNWSQDSLNSKKLKMRNEFNTWISSVVMKKIDTIPESVDIISIPEHFTCKIIDLGNAEEFTDKTDSIKGTIHIRCYRAPENFKTGIFNKDSDIWTLGCLLFEMLFNEKLLDSEYSNDTDEYIKYIEKVIDELPGIIREELEYVNFKNSVELEQFREFLLNTLKTDPLERWSIQTCIKSPLLKK